MSKTGITLNSCGSISKLRNKKLSDLKVVMFGATCLPYLLQETLQTHLSEYVAGCEFRDKFYVDNHLNTYDRECDLIKQQPILDELMNEAHMPLQEWVSSSKLFHSVHNSSPPSTQNVLGLEWDPRLDQLQIVLLCPCPGPTGRCTPVIGRREEGLPRRVQDAG